MLKTEGLKKFRCKRRSIVNQNTAKLRREWEREFRNFDWKRTPLRFSDECSIQLGSGSDGEWCFRYPHEKWDREMIEEHSTSRPRAQIV
ncbi:hypothetical protein CC78DRAFT_594991 [Lojkania enalia]|uniref:Transposase n=1 Tax=Lojkania enalia TaxID=147567 RepID=A0A9P4JZ26_9PLEO|nr:hypothetical protein CC78DRAFT_594991 [Didymosphaeria enalia]